MQKLSFHFNVWFLRPTKKIVYKFCQYISNIKSEITLMIKIVANPCLQIDFGLLNIKRFCVNWMSPAFPIIAKLQWSISRYDNQHQSEWDTLNKHTIHTRPQSSHFLFFHLSFFFSIHLLYCYLSLYFFQFIC